jgi:alanine dehydrogenase
LVKEEIMRIGILKETKPEEHRVALTPAGVEIMRRNDHDILIESTAGNDSGFSDEAYFKAGAQIETDPAKIFEQCEMILRVKEPQPQEYALLREGQIYFSYLHLASSRKIASVLMETRVVAVAYETIQTGNGALPLLTPMSEVAGPMAVQEGAKYLEMAQGGHGILLGGVPGVDPGTVLILGGGVVGLNAAKMACGLGARVYILDTDLERLRYLDDVMPGNCFLQVSSPSSIRELITKADLVVGAVLVPASKTPTLITRDMLGTMEKGAVLVDVAIDQGGCFETSRETTHADPIYTVDGIVHYAVSNMPGAVPRTSTLALTNATLPYALEIANRGWATAMRENPDILRGVNVVSGQITHQGVADALGMACAPITFL